MGKGGGDDEEDFSGEATPVDRFWYEFDDFMVRPAPAPAAFTLRTCRLSAAVLINPRCPHVRCGRMPPSS